MLPPTLFFILTAAAVAAGVTNPFGSLIGSPWRWAGAALVAGGLAVTIAGSRRFAAVGTNIKTFDDPDLLVDTGLFALTRNPMYLGFMFALVGVAIVADDVLGWLAPVAFFLAADRWYIPFEEDRMTETFGTEYETYRNHTRRWVGGR